MRHTHCLNWNMARNTEKREKEKCTLQDIENGEKTEKKFGK